MRVSLNENLIQSLQLSAYPLYIPIIIHAIIKDQVFSLQEAVWEIQRLTDVSIRSFLWK